ncbi:MAG: hypothetical protein DSY58_04780 [Desulfobulbus sp.]|nr:MAG: hypothetical protein DSY58_04780 [Desulfobulbus sp.]
MYNYPLRGKEKGMPQSAPHSDTSNPPSLPTVIGQDMHILNPIFTRALQQHDSKILAAMATQQVEAGARALDLNLGTTAKNRLLTAWVVDTIQHAVDVPLFISSQVLKQPEILQDYRGKITINSVTAERSALISAMETAGAYQAQLVVLLVRPGLTPFTADERLQLAAEVLETAGKAAFPIKDLYLDPLFHLRPDPLTWQLSRGMPDVDSVLETISLLPQLAGTHLRTLVALSSASQFLPAEKRSALHCRLLPLLTAAGLDAVILNSHDKQLMEIVQKPEGSTLASPPPIRNIREKISPAAMHW